MISMIVVAPTCNGPVLYHVYVRTGKSYCDYNFYEITLVYIQTLLGTIRQIIEDTCFIILNVISSAGTMKLPCLLLCDVTRLSKTATQIYVIVTSPMQHSHLLLGYTVIITLDSNCSRGSLVSYILVRTVEWKL